MLMLGSGFEVASVRLERGDVGELGRDCHDTMHAERGIFGLLDHKKGVGYMI